MIGSRHDAVEDGHFVRPYLHTGGRTTPRYPMSLETVLAAGPGRPRPGHTQVHIQVVELCRTHHRSVAELAGRTRLPVTQVKVLLSDLVDDRALYLPATSTDGSPVPRRQLLEAALAGLRKKFPDAVSHLRAG
ncbi:DUF742 domain-containing protein [Streptomyces acidiscabies]|uniref:DUF742 domain-containing protein n=1 Tax=Streptomyces acidiscabies TaxID=42234 RepID=A0AAP6EKX7_9ACTN|nr:DUF742 domain-containing protein [Streptomyces acidiscabies]MDX2966065.1 DUF742 domain-containing protein [Streptomyces acidiscabies]MDX3021306.1 DUF742 domain-containing protein [Streptomyces acidiscabies]MDX3793441.1 DUF742 domain-containing protein [Streptomyces acidiscabies]GAQ54841.1 hypothetical protein a10_04656 [Streptomyces acidiscabies]GAV43466.1 hypothetical protein Saa2_06418 [Streptomyces acidiscabies]